MLLPGCAGLVGGKGAAPLPAARHEDKGSFQVLKGRPGVVIGALHGASDHGTDIMGRDLARLTGFSLVVATGFSYLDGDDRGFNVRPTESVPGTSARLEGETAEARRVSEAYRRHVHDAAQGPLRLYVEVHGNAGKDSTGRVEIATVGLSREEAWQLKTLFELIRDAHLSAGGAAPRLDVWIESLDPLRSTASAAKQVGMLAASERALHIELPWLARTSSRDVYTGLVGDFLVQSAAVLIPREH